MARDETICLSLIDGVTRTLGADSAKACQALARR